MFQGPLTPPATPKRRLDKGKARAIEAEDDILSQKDQLDPQETPPPAIICSTDLEHTVQLIPARHRDGLTQATCDDGVGAVSARSLPRAGACGYDLRTVSGRHVRSARPGSGGNEQALAGTRVRA